MSRYDIVPHFKKLILVGFTIILYLEYCLTLYSSYIHSLTTPRFANNLNFDFMFFFFFKKKASVQWFSITVDRNTGRRWRCRRMTIIIIILMQQRHDGTLRRYWIISIIAFYSYSSKTNFMTFNKLWTTI